VERGEAAPVDARIDVKRRAPGCGGAQEGSHAARVASRRRHVQRGGTAIGGLVQRCAALHELLDVPHAECGPGRGSDVERLLTSPPRHIHVAALEHSLKVVARERCQ